MRVRRWLAAGLIAGAFANAASAEPARPAPASGGAAAAAAKACVPAPDAEVWMVKTSGTWKQGPRSGYYRVLVLRKGIEHANERVQVQFLEADDKANLRRLRGCVNLDSPGLKGYVSDLGFKKLDDTRIMLSIDIDMKAMNDVTLRELFLIDVKGEARRIVEAKSVEID